MIFLSYLPEYWHFLLNQPVYFSADSCVAVLSKALVCGRLIAGIAGSNPAEGMDVRLLCLLCLV